MREYITKAKVIEAIEKAVAPEITTIGDYETIGVFTRESIEQIVSNLHAADVAEVRHGRWDASDRYKFLDGSTCIRCTECGAALHLEEYQKYHWHYCPNCGARMDKEDEHEVG